MFRTLLSGAAGGVAVGDLLAVYRLPTHLERLITADPITRLNASLEGHNGVERELGEGDIAIVCLADKLGEFAVTVVGV